MQSLIILEPGRLGYAEASALQAKLVRRRQAGEIGDVLVLLEHPPVITLGRNARPQNLLRSPAELAGAGIELAECDRGGDVTFHGPGQLVGYPILDLRACARPAFLPPRSGRLELGPVDYVRALEEVLIGVAAECGVPGRRIPGLTGVWTVAEPARKLAAIGVHVARGVTSHGFALNVHADLAGFEWIVPCGIADRGVSSLARESGVAWSLAEVAAMARRHFLAVFARQLAEAPVLWDD
ncbi:MAG TPA: lipoyl(octanoyl) transferase LipB [Terriglobales bacterium]|nr:lipoyl(octanoyl) transferase LipB [Terriglobales bacterium]